jgi:peptidoglycan/xylan/chitin deacetylase (PgdA/CDA1 family)
MIRFGAETEPLPQTSPSTTRLLTDRYRCSQELPDFRLAGRLKPTNGYFRFGEDVVCYGQTVAETCRSVNGHLYDASQDTRRNCGSVLLPFDVTRVVDNLRYESYVQSGQRLVEKAWLRDIYYWFRPMFPVSFRKHLQKIYLRDWERIPFPAWPVDRSVDVLFERLLVLAMQVLQVDRLPFIWFWPEGHTAAAVVTHDVETTIGRDFCEKLMDIDDAFGIKASFQVVPEKRYTVPDSYLEAIRNRGFEINLQGLNHEGWLFSNEKEFVESANKINQYAKDYGANGFRSPILYRNLDWFKYLSFSYDMSVPNVARLEPQRGGCCTVMPYFLRCGMTELPLTTTQDYTLLHILGDYSTALWKQQMRIILDGHGLISFVVHPDYAVQDRAQHVYKSLLEELNRLQSDANVWLTLPRQVDSWWRERSQMTLVRDGREWKIEGKGSERARLAYARLNDGNTFAYEIDDDPSTRNSHPKV